MTHRPAVWTVAIVVGTGTLAVAQKVVGPEEFDRAMKTIGAALEGVEEALGSASYVEAKTPLALARQVLASTRPEWETKGQRDAVRMNWEAVAALDSLDEALSATTVDAAAVAAVLGDVTRACDACHATYREGDAQTGYRIRSTVSSDTPKQHVVRASGERLPRRFVACLGSVNVLRSKCSE